jgi:hypothetical protein
MPAEGVWRDSDRSTRLIKHQCTEIVFARTLLFPVVRVFSVVCIECCVVLVAGSIDQVRR